MKIRIDSTSIFPVVGRLSKLLQLTALFREKGEVSLSQRLGEEKEHGNRLQPKELNDGNVAGEDGVC